MTVKIEKKFDSLEKGIENMLDAAAYDYAKSGFTHKSSEDFRGEFSYSLGKKYIKIGQVSSYDPTKMGSVWAFVVKEDGGKFKKGDLLKAGGFNKPATNAARGNVLDGGFNINWTGPLYL